MDIGFPEFATWIWIVSCFRTICGGGRVVGNHVIHSIE